MQTNALDPKPHIFEQINIARNEPMDAWDVQALFGGFKTEAEARQFVHDLAELVEQIFGFEGGFVQ